MFFVFVIFFKFTNMLIGSATPNRPTLIFYPKMDNREQRREMQKAKGNDWISVFQILPHSSWEFAVLHTAPVLIVSSE